MSDSNNPFCTSGSSPPSDTNQPNNDWCTPEEVLRPIRKLFCGNIDLDPCSNEHSIVNPIRDYQLDRGEDGLVLPWFGRVFVNPPYSPYRLQDRFVWRCAEAYLLEQAEVVLLIPSAVETERYHSCIYPSASALCHIDGRVRFREPPPRRGVMSEADYATALAEFQARPKKKSSPTMSCSLIYWGQNIDGFYEAFSPLGFCHNLITERSRFCDRRYDAGSFIERLMERVRERRELACVELPSAKAA